jgi:hypothetical protein
MAEEELRDLERIYVDRDWFEEMRAQLRAARTPAPGTQVEKAKQLAPAYVLGLTPFTGKSVTRNYVCASHQDAGDSEHSFIIWYELKGEGQAPPPAAYFHMSGAPPTEDGQATGIRFRVTDGGVLFINTQAVWHHSTSEAGSSKMSSGSRIRKQVAQQSGVYGTALVVKPAVQRAMTQVHTSVVVPHLYAAKPSAQAAAQGAATPRQSSRCVIVAWLRCVLV